MKRPRSVILLFVCLLLVLGTSHVWAAVYVQCPGDIDGDAIPDLASPDYDPNVVCVHLSSGDGFINMADGYLQYIFGFADMTGIPEAQVLAAGALKAEFAAPTIVANEGQELYLSLTNVGMMIRPDLFDPHTVHFHGFPQASAIFDGLPESAISINMGSTLTYYYNLVQPGTYMYHCHVEATEHMQMGMLGNLYIHPAQNGTPISGFTTFAYNDGDGSTGYDVEFAIQLGSFDPKFHDASLNVQPLPFANMRDTYSMMNGRGYPDTVNPAQLANTWDGSLSQRIPSLITAQQGDRILLRLSNLNVTVHHTVTALGLPMQVVGNGHTILRGGGDPAGPDLYYNTSSVTLGGGESMDVLLDTTGVPPGTYFLYTTNLNYLSNNQEDFGGMMTEIVVN